MKIEILGAAREVTGSCYLVSNGQSRVLVECGMIQGGADHHERNRLPFDFDPGGLDALVLTHAHIDHSGRIPLLVKRGFNGPIYAHPATVELCRVMLRDSAFLSEKDADTENRKRRRRGEELVEPLYTQQDAEKALEYFQPIPYDSKLTVANGVDVSFQDAGHILGSCIVEMWVKEDRDTHKIVFSGDLGPAQSLLHQPPRKIRDADILLMESTYGDREHRSFDDSVAEFADVIKSALKSGGNILIPAFAVGRTQELLLMFAQHYKEWGLKDWKIFLDSPMAIAATRIYVRNARLLRKPHLRLGPGGRGIAELPNLQFTAETEESMAINLVPSRAIIIAGSGMCTGGRIRHHLKHNLWRKDCHVVFVGYQANGTLGRRLVDGAESVRLWGEEIKVAAAVHTIGGFSAHAGRTELLEWLAGFEVKPEINLIHGEADAAQSLAKAIKSKWGSTAQVPERGQTISLETK